MKRVFNYLKMYLINIFKQEDNIEVWQRLEFSGRRHISECREMA